MEKTWWSITSEYMGWKREQFLFTYDESEMQQNEVNKNNAGLIFYADYYPRYNSLLNLDTTLEEDIILSFLYYWTKNWKYIYVKNEDLALLIKWSVATATRVVKSLVDKWYIDMKIKRIVWAWTDRKLRLDPTKIILISQTNQIEESDKSNWGVIKEYIKKNNKENINSEVSQSPKPKSITPITNRDLTFEKIYNLFYHKSWHKPSLEKCKKVFDALNLDKEWYEMLVKDLKLFRVEYKYWIKDQMYRPWFEKYVGWFNAEWVNEEYRLKTIVKFHMDNAEDIEKWKKRYLDLCESFWKDTIDKLVKEYGKNKNKITLKAD